MLRQAPSQRLLVVTRRPAPANLAINADTTHLRRHNPLTSTRLSHTEIYQSADLSFPVKMTSKNAELAAFNTRRSKVDLRTAHVFASSVRSSSPSFSSLCTAAAACACARPCSSLTVAHATCTARRGFHSGLDESRVRRLRRSGMTFNRPRGRDTFSVAFESRLRIVPLTQMSDLYGPIDVSLLTAVNADDPTSSAGNPLEQKKYMAGDAQMRRVVEQKRRQEASIREKRDWHVLVVDSVELAAASAPIPYPSPHPAYYADWSDNFAASRQPRRGRTSVLQQRDACAFGDPSLPFLSSSSTFSAATTPGEGEETPIATTHEDCNINNNGSPETPMAPAYFYAARDRSHLQQNGDTTLLQGSQQRRTTLHLPDPASTAAAPLPGTPHTITQHFHTAVCVDPDIHHDRFHREEAQVEMITAYRNILYEAVEVGLSSNATPGGASLSGSGSLRLTSAMERAAPFVADVVRVPALCHYSCGRRLLHELGKLNQQSVIKGFHRLSNEAKEALISNRCFTVEIYVPPLLLEQFERAFLEEAWAPPTSTLNPGRTALYPGLAPPRTLLDYDGWTGKRPELIEAIETKGKSLLAGVKRGLDGRVIEESEVLAGLRVFGAREEQQKMLEGERETAAKEFGTPVKPTYAPLKAGLQEEVKETHQTNPEPTQTDK